MPLLSSLLYSILGCQTPEDFTRAYQMETLADGIGGPKSMAQPGDFIIENGHLRFAITGNRPSMGPHTAGGSLVDADIQRNNSRYANGFGNDQLAEIFTTVNINVAQINHEDGEVIILNDGSNGEPARVCAAGTAYSFISLFQAIWGVNTWLTPDKYISYSIRTDYILAKDDPVITMQSYILIGENEGCAADVSEARDMVSMTEYLNPETKLMDVAFDKGYIAGDFYLQGGSLNVFTPSIGFDEEGLIADLHNQQINMFNEPVFADFLAGVGDRVSYGIMNPKSPLLVPLFTSSQTVAVGGGLIPSEEE
ncbi:MAG: hypothetical protein VX278_07675, partial [Myxococcota bacterium]|nr:hypothetical protein [Myxococcota bacterium]